MYCGNCGNIVPDGAKFCNACGAQFVTEETPAAQETVQLGTETPVAQEFVQQETYVADNGFVSPDFNSAPKKKKSPAKLLLKIGIPVIAVALVVAIVLNMTSIIGFSIKTFGSDTSYYKFVEAKAIKDVVDDVTEKYGEVVDNVSKESQGFTGELSFTVSDDAIDMVNSFANLSGMDLKWLNDVKISLSSSANDDLTSAVLGLNVGKQEIAAFETIMDMAQGNIYVTLGELCKGYLKAEIPDFDEMSGMMNSISGAMKDAKNVLPDDKTLNKLLDKYIDIVLESAVDVKSSKDTVKVAGISQNCVALEWTVEDETLVEIAQNVLKEARNDKDIKEIVNNIQKYTNSIEELKTDVDFYEEFAKTIDSALESLEDVEESVQGAELFTISTYVNNSHEVIGRDLVVGNDKVIEYATAKKGKNFATEINLANNVTITGKGTEKSNEISGDYVISVQGQDYATVTLEKFDTKEFTGTVKVAPDKGLFSTMGVDASVSSLLGSLDPSFGVVIGENTASVNLYSKDEVFVGINISGKETKAEKVSVPSESDTYSSTDSDEIQEWLESVDFDKLVKNIENSDIPDELTDLIKSGVQALESGLFGGAEESVAVPVSPSLF